MSITYFDSVIAARVSSAELLLGVGITLTKTLFFKKLITI
jgi:hypothetical protein